MARKLTHDIWLGNVPEKTHNIFNILGVYTGKRNKIDVECKTCLVLSSKLPQSLVAGDGCNACAIEKKNNRGGDATKFYKRLDEAHNGTIISKSDFTKTNEPIDLCCTVCDHQWTLKFAGNSVSTNPSGCIKCRDESYRTTYTKTHSQYLIDLKKRHNDDYVVLEDYIDGKTPIKHKHISCGREDLYTPSYLLRETSDTGCKHCQHDSMRLSQDDVFTEIYATHDNSLIITSNYTGTNNPLDCICQICDNEWTSTAKVLKSGHGCQMCANKERGRQNSLNAAPAKRKRIESKGLEIIGELGMNKELTKVRNAACGHVFESRTDNLANTELNCPTCNIEEKRIRCKLNNDNKRETFLETADEWHAYRYKVYSLTKATYAKHHKTINPNNLTRTLAGVEDGYQLDHIVPIRYCFDHQIPADMCSHKDNLQMLSWHANLTSHAILKEDWPKIFLPYMI